MKDDCIETPHGVKDKDGYPRAKYQGRLEVVSRTVMGLLYGRGAIAGKLVCHTCNNSSCVNPSHLYIGDPQTNSDDKWVDGTMCEGERNGRFNQAVSTEDLHYMYNDLGMTQTAIAKQVDLTQSSISARLRKYDR